MNNWEPVQGKWIDRGREPVWEAIGVIEDRMVKLGEGWDKEMEQLRGAMKDLGSETANAIQTVLGHVRETDRSTEENRRRVDRTLEVAQEKKTMIEETLLGVQRTLEELGHLKKNMGRESRERKEHRESEVGKMGREGFQREKFQDEGQFLGRKDRRQGKVRRQRGVSTSPSSSDERRGRGRTNGLPPKGNKHRLRG